MPEKKMPLAKKARRGKELVSTSAAKVREDENRSTLFVNSVDKAMKVLRAFNQRSRHLTMSQIATHTGMDVSSTQRFIYTLTNLGYLQKDPVTRTYDLAPKMLDFAYDYLASNELVYRATPYIQHLSKETEDTTNLTVLDGCDIVFLLRIVSRHVLNPHVIVGTRLPAFCTAPGLAILAHLPEAEAQQVLQASELVKHTQFTENRPQAIIRRLARVRELGYAHTEEEFYLGDISTAAAILDSNGRPIGAVNVAIPKPRWKGEQDERRIADLVIAAAASVSAVR